MKLKHNKKRNTAFIYEALSRCLTEAIVKKDKDRKNINFFSASLFLILNLEEIFSQQSSMIKKINKELGKDFFSVFTPNYKSLANISHIFNKKTDARSRVILERKLVTYKMYVNKFNEKYDDKLIEEQKNLLTMYITSFNDDGVEFRYFLNEELGRIKQKLTDKCEEKPELISVLEKFDNIKTSKFSDSDLQMILKGQQLVKELQ